MSAPAFALTSPSLTDMSDAINLADARAAFYAAEAKDDAALAAWARKYAPPLLERAAQAPTDATVEEVQREAAQEAAAEAEKLKALEIDDLLSEAAPAFKAIEKLHHDLEKLACRADKKAA